MEQTLTSYRIFYTVALTNNISHAAKELYISQPAISKSLSKLENSLGVKLFHRGSRGVTLTTEGDILFHSIKQAFENIQEGEDNIRKISQYGIGHLRVGVSTTLCKYILLPYLKKFMIAYPNIKITIDCQSTLKTIELLEQGHIDIGFVAGPNMSPNVNFSPITTIKDIFVTTSSYLNQLLFTENIDSSKLSSKVILEEGTLMLLDEKNLSRIYVENYLKNQNISIKNLLQVSDMDLLIEFAKIGLGISCVIKEFVSKELETEELIQLELDESMKEREVGFAYSSHNHMNSSLEKFIQYYHLNSNIYPK